MGEHCPEWIRGHRYRGHRDPYRHANVNYFAGRGGVTSATGYSPATVQSYGDPNFVPDLRKDETRINLAMLVRF